MTIAIEPLLLVRELLWVIVVPVREIPEDPVIVIGELKVVVPELAI